MLGMLRSGSRQRRTPALLVVATVLGAVALCPVRCIARAEQPPAPPCHRQQGHPASGDPAGSGCRCPALVAIVDESPRPDAPRPHVPPAPAGPAMTTLLPGTAGADASPVGCGRRPIAGPPVYLRVCALRI